MQYNTKPICMEYKLKGTSELQTHINLRLVPSDPGHRASASNSTVSSQPTLPYISTPLSFHLWPPTNASKLDENVARFRGLRVSIAYNMGIVVWVWELERLHCHVTLHCITWLALTIGDQTTIALQVPVQYTLFEQEFLSSALRCITSNAILTVRKSETLLSWIIQRHTIALSSHQTVICI